MLKKKRIRKWLTDLSYASQSSKCNYWVGNAEGLGRKSKFHRMFGLKTPAALVNEDQGSTLTAPVFHQVLWVHNSWRSAAESMTIFWDMQVGLIGQATVCAELQYEILRLSRRGKVTWGKNVFGARGFAASNVGRLRLGSDIVVIAVS